MKTPKYKIGDEVWYLFDSSLRRERVGAIIAVYETDSTKIKEFKYICGKITRTKESGLFEYTLAGMLPVLKWESQLFPTKQELIDSL